MEILLTISGMKFYEGTDLLNAGNKVVLKKELDNPYDNEAIQVYRKDIGQIGYVANSVHTVAKGTYSAGRLYDKFEGDLEATILVVTQHLAIAKIDILEN